MIAIVKTTSIRGRNVYVGRIDAEDTEISIEEYLPKSKQYSVLETLTTWKGVDGERYVFQTRMLLSRVPLKEAKAFALAELTRRHAARSAG